MGLRWIVLKRTSLILLLLNFCALSEFSLAFYLWKAHIQLVHCYGCVWSRARIQRKTEITRSQGLSNVERLRHFVKRRCKFLSPFFSVRYYYKQKNSKQPLIHRSKATLRQLSEVGWGGVGWTLIISVLLRFCSVSDALSVIYACVTSENQAWENCKLLRSKKKYSLVPLLLDSTLQN